MPTNKAILSVFAVLVPFLQGTVSANEIVFSSANEKTQLVELYTSQGCSSCPPADNFLSNAIPENKLWKDIIPLAFHVDYWNYLGWKDVFSSKANTNRQLQHHKYKNVSNVYTPSFVVNGNEWRGFFNRSALPQKQSTHVGPLSLTFNSNTGSVGLEFINLSNRQPSFCNFAILGFGQTIKIKSGENRGLNLAQNFTVLFSTKTKTASSSNQFHCQSNLAEFKFNQPLEKNKYALVAWVSEENQRHIQATGGWL